MMIDTNTLRAIAEDAFERTGTVAHIELAPHGLFIRQRREGREAQRMVPWSDFSVTPGIEDRLKLALNAGEAALDPDNIRWAE